MAGAVVLCLASQEGMPCFCACSWIAFDIDVGGKQQKLGVGCHGTRRGRPFIQSKLLGRQRMSNKSVPRTRAESQRARSFPCFKNRPFAVVRSGLVKFGALNLPPDCPWPLSLPAGWKAWKQAENLKREPVTEEAGFPVWLPSGQAPGCQRPLPDRTVLA